MNGEITARSVIELVANVIDRLQQRHQSRDKTNLTKCTCRPFEVRFGSLEPWVLSCLLQDCWTFLWLSEASLDPPVSSPAVLGPYCAFVFLQVFEMFPVVKVIANTMCVQTKTVTVSPCLIGDRNNIGECVLQIKRIQYAQAETRCIFYSALINRASVCGCVQRRQAEKSRSGNERLTSLPLFH